MENGIRKIISDKKRRILVRKADRITRKSRDTYWMARIFFERSKKPLFYLWYSYLRWVDDTIDASEISKKEKLNFTARQINLVKAIISSGHFIAAGRAQDIQDEELFLMLLITTDNKLLKTILEALKYANIMDWKIWTRNFNFIDIAV